MSQTETVSTKAAAEACDTTPRLLRQFLRASKDYTAVGSGGRYAFEANDLPTLKTRFVAWVAEREAAQAAREKAAAEAEAAKVAATPRTDPGSGADVDTDADETEADDAEDEPEPVKAKPAPRGRKVAA